MAEGGVLGIWRAMMVNYLNIVAYKLAFCQKVAAVVKAIVVNVGYRLAPEHPFPIPVEDCFTSVLWVRPCTSYRPLIVY